MGLRLVPDRFLVIPEMAHTAASWVVIDSVRYGGLAGFFAAHRAVNAMGGRTLHIAVPRPRCGGTNWRVLVWRRQMPAGRIYLGARS